MAVTGTLGFGAVHPAEVTIEDDDTRAVTVNGSGSDTHIEVDEAATTSIVVVLGSAPTEAVTVTPQVAGSGDVTVSGPLTFAPATWDTAQTLTVRAAGDADAQGDEAVVSLAVAGGDYEGFAAPAVTVRVVDDELGVELTVAPAEVAEDAPPATHHRDRRVRRRRDAERADAGDPDGGLGHRGARGRTSR